MHMVNISLDKVIKHHENSGFYGDRLRGWIYSMHLYNYGWIEHDAYHVQHCKDRSLNIYFLQGDEKVTREMMDDGK